MTLKRPLALCVLLCLLALLLWPAPARAQAVALPTGAQGDFPRVDQGLWRSQVGLRLDQNAPPANPAPTVTYSASQPAATPTSIAAISNGQAANPSFAYLGGLPVQYGFAFPDYNSVVCRFPFGVLSGTGGEVVEFVSDAPSITVNVKPLGGGERISVDDVEVCRSVPGVTGTAQAGASATITLAAGASASNNYYNQQWVTVSGGTGAGQSRLITGYAGSTKIATVSQAWATAPDATSTYVVAKARGVMQAMASNGSGGYVNLDWGGERRFRRYRLDLSGTPFYGVNVTSSADTVAPAPKRVGPVCLWMGDSYSAGTGGDAGFSSLSFRASSLLGWDFWGLSVGGTGYVNPGTFLNFADRAAPPVNAWLVTYVGGSGSIVYTQGGVSTAPVASNATAATMQAAFDAAFGTGAFFVGNSANQWIILGRGSNATNTAPLTLNLSGFTPGSVTATSVQYQGDIAPFVPKDGAGSALPFVLVWAGGHNDTADTSAAYTPALLQSTATALYAAVRARYPTCTQIVVGYMGVTGSPDGNVLASDSALLAAATASLPAVNGRVPFVETMGQGAGNTKWVTGTGNVLSPAGNGNADVLCDIDAVHPSMFGHAFYGQRLAQAIAKLLTGN